MIFDARYTPSAVIVHTRTHLKVDLWRFESMFDAIYFVKVWETGVIPAPTDRNTDSVDMITSKLWLFDNIVAQETTK